MLEDILVKVEVKSTTSGILFLPCPLEFLLSYSLNCGDG